MNKWIIITQPSCTPCIEAKAMLKEREIFYDEFNIVVEPSIRDFLKAMLDKPTTPQVFLNGYRIGGRDELKAYFDAVE